MRVPGGINPTRNIKKHHTEEQIIGILKQGKPLPELLREHGIASGTFYRRKSKYGGLESSHHPLGSVSQIKEAKRILSCQENSIHADDALVDPALARQMVMDRN